MLINKESRRKSCNLGLEGKREQNTNKKIHNIVVRSSHIVCGRGGQEDGDNVS